MKRYEIHGLKRRSSSFNTDRVDHLYVDLHESGARFFLHYADLSDPGSLARCLADVQPDEVYNLGAQSHVKVSYEIPEYTSDVTAMGTVRLLEAIRRTGLQCRFYQASSARCSAAHRRRRDEGSRFHPRSPYACAKVYAHQITVNYRESYGMHASGGILFNHESPGAGRHSSLEKSRRRRRGSNSACRAAVSGKFGRQRDWGFAGDYVEAMWSMLQQDSPDDYVIGTGESHSVREFAELAFGRWDWTGRNTSKWTRDIFALPK